MSKPTDDHTSVKDRVGHILTDAYRRAAVLAEVDKLTDAYRLKVLVEATAKLRKSMAEQGSSLPLCADGKADYDDAS